MTRDLPPAATSLTYRPDIDGLRSIAVLAVLLYHASVAPFSGGYVGVDVFFVISGYLIMATLAADIRAGRFSIQAFYDRRIRRIFPALFAMALFSALAAAVLFPPVDFADFGRTLVAMALFVSNVFFLQNSADAGYFATGSETQLLLHTWSLSVEEQFYIFLPIGLFFLRFHSEKVTAIWLVVLALASFALSVWCVAYHPLAAFYLVFPRAWELLVGALLAIKLPPPLRSRLSREVIGLLGIALIVYAIFGFSKQTPFPGASALLPCLGSCFIIYAGETGPNAAGSLLATRPPVFIGKISYSLYLWHWPIIVFVKGLNTGKLNVQSTIVIIVSSFIAAYLSYRFVEQPFRRKGPLLTRPRVLAGGVAASLAAAAIGAGIDVGQGFPQRYEPRLRAVIAANVARQTDHTTGDCENWRTKVVTLADIKLCPLNHGESQNILFWGDSHMGSLQPLVGTLYAQGALGGRGAIFTIAASCTPDPNMNRLSSGYYCGTFSRLALDRAKGADIGTVFIAFSAWWDDRNGELCQAVDDRCVRVLSRRDAEDLFIRDLYAAVRALRQGGKRVVISLPAPTYNQFIPRKQINDAILGRLDGELRDAGVIRRLQRNDYVGLRARLTSLASELGATLYDPRVSLCEGDRCIFERDGISLYSDDNHIAASQIDIFRDALRNALR